MDMSIIYIIGFIIITIGLVYLINFLQNKKQINANLLDLVTNGLGVGCYIIDELNLKNEEKIVAIGSIVVDSVNYAKDVLKATTNEDLVNIAIAYACKLCEDQGIEINESRTNIITSLVKLSVNIAI